MAVLIALASPLLAMPQGVSPATIARVKNSVVPVVCGRLDQRNEFHVVQSLATGFLINSQGNIVTAEHAASDLTKFSASNNYFGAIFVVAGGEASEDMVTTRWFRITTCQADPQRDLAACFLSENPMEDAELKSRIAPLKFTSPFRYSEGTPVAFTGYPLRMGRPLTSKGYIAARYPDQLIVDKSVWPGASGSPVYTAEGKVIGLILKTGLGLGTGLTYAAPADAIMNFLSKNEIAFEQ